MAVGPPLQRSDGRRPTPERVDEPSARAMSARKPIPVLPDVDFSSGGGLDLLCEAAREARDEDGAAFQIQTIVASTKRRTPTTKKRGRAMVDRTNRRVDTLSSVKKGATTTVKRGRPSNATDVSSCTPRGAETPTAEGMEELAWTGEMLATESADVVIERVRQWLDLLVGDTRARLSALKRSAARTQMALKKYQQSTPETREDDVDRVENELGIEMLKEFEKTLDIERDGLIQTLDRLERMRTKTEYEAAKLALGWLNRSNQDEDHDEDGGEEENAVSWYEYTHSSSARAFLQVALGTFMYDKTPVKPVKPDMASPAGIIDAAARLFT